MTLKETEVLPILLWPFDKLNMLGTLNFDLIDFESVTSIAVNRQASKLEVLYSSVPIEDIGNKTYYVKLFFEKNSDELSVNLEKTSPEIKSDSDVNDVLKLVHDTIVKMGTRPLFFPTGVVKPSNSLKI